MLCVFLNMKGISLKLSKAFWWWYVCVYTYGISVWKWLIIKCRVSVRMYSLKAAAQQTLKKKKEQQQPETKTKTTPDYLHLFILAFIIYLSNSCQVRTKYYCCMWIAVLYMYHSFFFSLFQSNKVRKWQMIFQNIYADVLISHQFFIVTGKGLLDYPQLFVLILSPGFLQSQMGMSHSMPTVAQMQE